jgi:asparagine synthase (glutamine-hydrolysing)
MCSMCGIFALLNPTNDDNTSIEVQTVINEQFMKGKNRGPEFSKLETQYLNMVLGFHRLAINGLNIESNQPIVFNDIVLICNGEIYNYRHLYNLMDVKPMTDSDCEVIIHLYLKYGIEQTLIMLDGVYSFILYDNRVNTECINKVYIARDPLGVRPLYKLYNINNTINYNLLNLYGFASELKCLEYFYNLNNEHYHIEQFEPGTYSIFQHESKVKSQWEQIVTNKPHYIPSFSYSILATDIEYLQNNFLYNTSSYLNAAVIKRCKITQRPVACLLSGGLDSSLIAALASNYFSTKGVQIETYSIGLVNSEDIKYAKIVAEYIGSKHTEIIVSEDDMFNAIPEVIKAIESYDTTTVRASIGNYLIGKYISKNSEAKVILNGDGSDELLGGYLYMHNCPDDIEFDKETRRLLKDIHLFDVLRSDKSISSNGLEPRTPFLDRSFVNYVLSIPVHFRNHINFRQPEKYLLRSSFSEPYFFNKKGKAILPDEILWRKKEAFSDGVSSHGRSLYTILQEKIQQHYYNIQKNKITMLNRDYAYEYFKNKVLDKPSIELEKKYYKEIFDKEFPNCSHVLPYFWMPKYTNATDPSARTLELYKND